MPKREEEEGREEEEEEEGGAGARAEAPFPPFLLSLPPQRPGPRCGRWRRCRGTEEKEKETAERGTRARRRSTASWRRQA